MCTYVYTELGTPSQLQPMDLNQCFPSGFPGDPNNPSWASMQGRKTDKSALEPKWPRGTANSCLPFASRWM